MAGRVWTTKRQWMGNLVPLLCMLPFGAAGVWLCIITRGFSAIGVAICGVALIVGWFAVNQFGFFGNAFLKREIQRKVLAKINRDASEATFVGFARPSYVGLLDAHEDLGYLFIGSESLDYFGEKHQVSLARKEVLGVRYRSNIHSALGLGRWISVEAMRGGKRIRLLVEPREASTLLQNRKLGTVLRRRIEDWLKSDGQPLQDSGAPSTPG